MNTPPEGGNIVVRPEVARSRVAMRSAVAVGTTWTSGTWGADPMAMIGNAWPDAERSVMLVLGGRRLVRPLADMAMETSAPESIFWDCM